MVVPLFSAILFLVLYINLTPRIQLQNLISDIPPQKNKQEDEIELKYEKTKTPYSPRKPAQHDFEHPEIHRKKDKVSKFLKKFFFTFKRLVSFKGPF